MRLKNLLFYGHVQSVNGNRKGLCFLINVQWMKNLLKRKIKP